MKNSLVIALFSVVVLGSGFAAFGQTFAQPREMPIAARVKQAFPSYYARRLPFAQLIPESFYPIGWSRDGKFAYYVEPVDEACGCYFARLVIQDMRTDTVLWEFKYSQDDTYEGDKMTGPSNIAAMWKKNRSMFSEKLAEHRIIAGRSTLLGKTFTIGGKSFTAKAATKMGKNPDEDWPRVDLIDISLSSPRLGSKSVYKADHTDKEYWFMLNAGVIGAIKSPYENRVAIVAIEVMRGYEGPPHTAQIRVTGADLVSGFSN